MLHHTMVIYESMTNMRDERGNIWCDKKSKSKVVVILADG